MAPDAKPAELTADELLDGYRTMLVLRRFEEEMQRLFLRGEIHGTVHLYIGQEAVSAGVCSALGPGDWVAATYRGHGAALAQGCDPEGLAAEMLGRRTGTCGGRGGSMNVVDLVNGLIGCFGIVGGSVAAATGAALSCRGTGRVAVAFFGDGSTNQAYFHECLNFAKVFTLPVVFVCENNLYGEFTPLAYSTAGADITARARAYDIPAERIDGNRYEVVATAAREAVARARAGEGPQFIEAMTYRQVGHSKSDAGRYRPDGELEAWLERDPLLLLRETLGDDVRADAVDAEVTAQLAEAVERALAAPLPDPAIDRATEYAP